MGGCASRPKESDMNNEEGSVPNKPVSETVVVQENNTEESGEKQNQTETETTSVEAKEISEVEPTKETSPAVEESSSAGAPEKVETVVAATENAEAAVVAAPEKVAAEPVKDEVKKEGKEAVVTV